ncbi:MAG: hypothetical protein ACJAVX_003053 [Pseudoalteromonas rhizosphaerae]|jgi:hypothetical protein|uniref:hypothetical protein n=1 Tax=Pseudoalteromonas rhizosphaerae TaxID=2518973 RepID=UPI0039E2D7C5
MANYEEYQNFTINPRKPKYKERVTLRTAVKDAELKKGRIRRRIEAYQDQHRIDSEHGLDYLFEEQS